MIKKTAAISLVVDVVVSAFLLIFMKNTTVLTAFTTHALLIINLLGICLLWSVIIQKKSIALGLLIIILKYPLLGYVIVQMTKQTWFEALGLFVGFLSFILSIVFVTVIKKVNSSF